MGWGLLAPLFAAGLGLTIIPWIVHRIRRPQRRPVRFSSLMFVPEVRRQTMERRKIQHPWLMALRMLLLALLAAAFARPYVLVPRQRAGDAKPARRVLLIDVSMSMRADDRFDRVQRLARQIIDHVGPADCVGVIAFDDAPRILAPLDDARQPDAGSPALARRALDALEPGWGRTAYVPALQAAEAMLLEGDERAGDDGTERIVHLLTDFQQSGMPDVEPTWRLSPRVQLRPIDVGAAPAPNFGLIDASVEQTRTGDLRVRAKVRNWSGPPRAAHVRLTSGGAPLDVKAIEIGPGNASQIVLTWPDPGDRIAEAHLELADDRLPADNVFYVAWNPRRKARVMLAVEADTVWTRWPPAAFVRAALPAAGAADRLPWERVDAEVPSLERALADPLSAPDIVVVLDAGDLTDGGARALLDFVRRGGRALLMLGARSDPPTVNARLLESLGLRCTGRQTDEPDEAVFAVLSWVDLRHPIFEPFQDAQYNDFTSLRFYNYHRLEVAERADDVSGASRPRIVARFDDEHPAMLEVEQGEGRLVIWAFAPDLAWTNLPRKAAFVPLFHETLTRLTPSVEAPPAVRVGDPLLPPAAQPGQPASWLVQWPGNERLVPLAAQAARPAADRPGFVRWRLEGADGWTRVDAVNIDPRESDPTRIDPAEFAARLCAASASAGASATPAGALDEFWTRRELGYDVLWLIALVLALETWYAARLAARPPQDPAEVSS